MNDEPKRTPGRPLADTSDLRQRLLDTALDSFAHAGIRATSLRGIAQRCGVTPALLNYYFGNKERLVDAVVEERLLPLMLGMGERLEQAGDDPRELVAAFVRGMSASIRANPWLPPLWVREILCEGGVLRDLLTTRVAPLVPLLLARRFAEAQGQGRLNPGLDPRLLVVSLIGLTLLPYASAPLWRNIFDAPEIDDEAMIRHTLNLLGQGLEVPDAR
ncbi:HTH-type transcriptional regulator BetI [compost metagenome]|uniref:Transcriptional regulator, TetR family n=1 Tax=Pseudomonas jinjuensis TaxID=198616 RepID=A0A1H0KPC8_9PSED|nr:TetR/AcrR family transcriptional regulator [Pseudomonas jinjuensis]SDO57789.1 transcriptional regulator, TetR family [Pseudomonas jinjuensis]